MPRKKCPKNDVNSSPSGQSSEYCLTEEEMRNIIPPFIWEKQQETLKRAGLSPPDHMQFAESRTDTLSENGLGEISECDFFLKCLDDVDLAFDDEEPPPLWIIIPIIIMSCK
jgi:hypothetical protein